MLVFYGTSDCKKCQSLKKELLSKGAKFRFVDANADNTQAECDLHNVDKLPHVIQINPDNGDKMGEWIGDQTNQLLEQIKKN